MGQKPPSLFEIFMLPITGAAIIDLFHTRQNELMLLAVPFLIAGVRLFIAQFQRPAGGARSDNIGVRRAVGVSVAVNQFSVIVLTLAECGVVMVTSPGMPGTGGAPVSVGIIVGGIFGAYFGLRMISRHYWIVAAARLKMHENQRIGALSDLTDGFTMV